jgi:hypothetical protein
MGGVYSLQIRAPDAALIGEYAGPVLMNIPRVRVGWPRFDLFGQYPLGKLDCMLVRRRLAPVKVMVLFLPGSCYGLE